MVASRKTIWLWHWGENNAFISQCCLNNQEITLCTILWITAHHWKQAILPNLEAFQIFSSDALQSRITGGATTVRCQLQFNWVQAADLNHFLSSHPNPILARVSVLRSFKQACGQRGNRSIRQLSLRSLPNIQAFLALLTSFMVSKAVNIVCIYCWWIAKNKDKVELLDKRFL